MADDDRVVLFKHPGRYLFTGKSGSGKTTLAIQVILRMYCKTERNRNGMDRIIVLCPTYFEQSVFDPIRKFIRDDRDIYLQITKDSISEILEQLITQYHLSCNSNQKPPSTLVLIDDMGGNRALHGGRHGDFPEFCLQSRHYNTSVFVISQQPKSITPAFRDNLEGVVIYPSLRRNDVDWAYEEYGTILKKNDFIKILKKAWRGPGRSDDAEWGQHFLFILLLQRAGPRYFTDFSHELFKRKAKLPIT